MQLVHLLLGRVLHVVITCLVSVVVSFGRCSFSFFFFAFAPQIEETHIPPPLNDSSAHRPHLANSSSIFSYSSSFNGGLFLIRALAHQDV